MDINCANNILCQIFQSYGLEPFFFGLLSAVASLVSIGVFFVATEDPVEDGVDPWLAVLIFVASAFLLGTILGVVITQSAAATSHAPISDADGKTVIPPQPPIPPCNLQPEGCIYTPTDDFRDIIAQYEHLLGIDFWDWSYADRHNVDEDIIVELDCDGDGFADAGGRAGDLAPQPSER